MDDFYPKKLNMIYKSDNTSGGVGCFCSGKCEKLGYCPNVQETPTQKARRLGVPLFDNDPSKASDIVVNPVVGVCGRCNIEFRLNYRCFKDDCPCMRGKRT